MTLPFVVDDAGPVPGVRAIFLGSAGDYSHDCRTLGYECTVLGQIRMWRATQREKNYLVYIDYLDAPFIARESELVECQSHEVPPIRAQGEIVIAWREQNGDPQITGTYRPSLWVPRKAFLIRYSDTCEPRFRTTKSNDGVEYLTYEAPPGVKLDDQFVVNALGKVTGQRLWRLLPYID